LWYEIKILCAGRTAKISTETYLENPHIIFLHGGFRVIGNHYVPDRFDYSKKVHLKECVIGGIIKVWIENGCTAYGMCESICPEVFTVEDEATVNQGVNCAEFSHQIEEAADSCPVEVIKYEIKEES